MISVHVFSRCMSCYFSCLICGCNINFLYFLYIEKRFEIEAIDVEFLYNEYFILRKITMFDLTLL
jgi:hypothetical protein